MKLRLRHGVFLCCFLGAAAAMPTKMAALDAGKGAPGAGQASPQPASSSPAPTPTPAPAILRWNNGESIPGEVSEADDATLIWKTPLFEDALLLAWPALHRIDHTLPDSAPADTFAFVLRDGSHLYGDLTGVAADTVTIHGARHGDATLRRAEVLSARRIKGQRLVYAGPLGESGWSPAPKTRANNERTATTDEPLGNVQIRATGPGGSLVIPFWHRAFLLALPLPDRVDVEFRLHAKERPAFRLVLEGGAKQRLRVETWGDELVLAAANAFEKIRTVGEQEREISLRVCWDRQARRAQVYTPEGRLLKEWTVPEEESGKQPGVQLQNNGRELTLDTLRVRAWDGQPPAVVDVGQPRVELDDGRAVAGTVGGMEAGTVAMPAPGEGPPANFPLADVDAIIFSVATPGENRRETTLAYTDGTFLRGQLAGIKDGAATLKTTFTETPLAAKTDALRQAFIQVPASAGTPPEPALKTLDKITVQDIVLHGHLSVTAGDASPHWISVGAQWPATPAGKLAAEITLAAAPETVPTVTTTLFYTRLGDVLPGVLHGLDRSKVEFDSPLIEAKEMPAGELQAVQFDVSSQRTIQGFDAPGWENIRGPKADLQKNGGTLKLAENSPVGCPSAAQAGEIKLTYDTTNFSCVRFRMFCDGLNPARALNYIVSRMGNNVYTGVETTEGQFSAQNRIIVAGGPLAVRFNIDDKGLRCSLNDSLAEIVPFSKSKRAGAGLIIEAASLWGNGVQEVSLSKFSAVAEPGQNFVLNIHPDAKSQTLTVPRFRRDDLPRHALVAANGDLLRGEIEAITNTQLGFRIGLDTLRVPRDRVSAVITLRKPVEDTPIADEAKSARKLLDRSINQRTWYNGINFQTLIGLVKKAVPDLKLDLPSGVDSRQVPLHFNDQSVGETLDTACDLFDLRYHIDKGVVVIERRAPGLDTGLVQRVYWLRSNPFAGAALPQDVLAAKGVTFARGASVDWKENARQLVMTNTAACQDKLADVLEKELGGVAGSPTHWLRLTNGGRLGLTVDRFDADAISGTHPIYGRCTVPLPEVYTIRNTLPEFTAAESAVNGWQLVYAPEPVLPESGGGESALLGKEAPAFKLGMLDAGKFDLSQEKGYVIVLDFWATWCGPCIQSLPGLIAAMAQFPADRVKLIGLDQAEAPEQVKRFLETRGWKLAVALDAGQNVARQYRVDGIPHTVIIGPDGKVAWVKTGYSPDGEAQAAEAVKKLLASGVATPAAAPAP